MGGNDGGTMGSHGIARSNAFRMDTDAAEPIIFQWNPGGKRKGAKLEIDGNTMKNR